MKENKQKNKGGLIIEKMFSGKGFYLTLAGITLAVGVITFFGIRASFSPTPVDPDVPEVPVDDPADVTVIPDEPTGPSEPSTPVTPDVPDKPDEPSGEITPTPVTPSVQYILPTSGVLTKDFSGDALVFSSTMGDYRVHTGIDITVSEGSEVVAVADGTVKSVYTDDMKGVCVEIEHADGVVSVYCNLKAVLGDKVVAGGEIKSGEVVGYVGTSALFEVGEPSHLHFEMLVDGEPVSPTDILPEFAVK